MNWYKTWEIQVKFHYTAGTETIETVEMLMRVKKDNINYGKTNILRIQIPTDLLAYRALASARRCFWPPDKFIPLSPISVWSPPGSMFMSWLSEQLYIAS